jgi:hypothetical protein
VVSATAFPFRKVLKTLGFQDDKTIPYFALRSLPQGNKLIFTFENGKNRKALTHLLSVAQSISILILIIDKNFLFIKGSIRNVLLCVKVILVTTGNLGHKTSVVNIVYYGLKSCIFVGLRNLWITGSKK